MKFLCIGPIFCDIAMKSVEPDDFKHGRTVLDSFEIAGGGDANNAAIDLSILGEEARVFGGVGRDFLGDRVLTLLTEKGVDVSFVKRSDLPTSTSVLLLSDHGETTLNLIRKGANEALEPQDVTDEMIAWADHIHVVSVMNLHGFDGAGVESVLSRAHAMGKTTSMDLKKRLGSLDDRMTIMRGPLAHCDVFLPSNHEVEYLCGLTDPREAAQFFRPFGLRIFGSKLGADGVYLTDYKEEVLLPSLYRGTPVDVIGAGDAFASTFVCAYKRGYDLRTCGLIASAASASVVGSVGATSGMRDFETLLSIANQARA